MKQNLFNTIWKLCTIAHYPSGRYKLLVGAHFLHEVTSPQAFAMIEKRGLSVKYPANTFATVDHVIPTNTYCRPLQDPLAEEQIQHLEKNTAKHGITLFGPGHENNGIVHVIMPELGITQPGKLIVCGDSHTCTHGAFGSIAFGIGTTQVASVLATGCILFDRPKVRKIQIDGVLGKGVTAKDVILAVINRLGVKGGIGYAYEFAGTVIEGFNMEQRMTVCNMATEGGAQCGYVCPDQTTIEYLRGRKYVPAGTAFEEAAEYWLSLASPPDALYDDVFILNAKDIEPMMTYGVTPGQSVCVGQVIPHLPEDASPGDKKSQEDALNYMELKAGDQLLGTKVDVVFIGSCTNDRISDLREAAALIREHDLKVAFGVRALVVPGSESVRRQAEAEGLHTIFLNAGYEWREPGCSMCLAMNPDKLVGNQLCASTSNRNFKNRQGSETGRTVLMSPISAAACAAAGCLVDVRELSNAN